MKIIQTKFTTHGDQGKDKVLTSDCFITRYYTSEEGDIVLVSEIDDNDKQFRIYMSYDDIDCITSLMDLAHEGDSE